MVGRRATHEIDVAVTATPPPRRPVRAFDRWVASAVRPGDVVLDIGAGCHVSGDLPRTRARAGRLVGVDPDARIRLNEALDERHQATMEAFAPDHPAEFDAAFSVFVLEHVTDPRGFTAGCATVLKPHGVLFGLTVNKWHYFGLSTWAATRLGISEWLLPKVRHATEVESYHFPTAYGMNTVRQVSRLLAAEGFTAVEFRMWDRPSMYTPYLPGPLTGVARAWSACAYRLDWAQVMGNLTFKATRG